MLEFVYEVRDSAVKCEERSILSFAEDVKAKE